MDVGAHGLTAMLGAAFVIAAVAPIVARRSLRGAIWLTTFTAVVLTGLFISFLPGTAEGVIHQETLSWVPAAGVELAFRVDGLSLLFSLMIAVVGVLIFIYSAVYMKAHRRQGAFFGFLLFFMAAMLGLVLAADVVSLFVFWELTSIASFFLIGFEHEKKEAAVSARQALIVTALGGLALLAGLILMGEAAGSYRLAELIDRGEAIRASSYYPAILVLMVLGAFTKSAQFPFHFWLPGAMVAPTPVSAYLHSATMVKAGLYLLARFSPVLGGTPGWFWLLAGGGALTMATGAVWCFFKRDLKLILAYMTLAALGMLMLLLGLGHPVAHQAFVLYLLVHSLYKGALFLVAGIVDHETGTRDIRRLGGLAGPMKLTFAAAVLAVLSMGGIFPFLGFAGKEYFYAALLPPGPGGPLLSVYGVVIMSVVVAFAVLLAYRPFFGRASGGSPGPVHEAPFGMLAGPLFLGVLALAAGPFLGRAGGFLLEPAIAAMTGGIHPAPDEFLLWKGTGAPFIMSVISVLAGVLLAWKWDRIRRAGAVFARFGRALDGARGYDRVSAAVEGFAHWQTRVLQSGKPEWYLAVAFAFLAALLLVFDGLEAPVWPGGAGAGLTHYDAAIIGLIVFGGVFCLAARRVMVLLIALGAVGYGTALVYLVFGAPDLALTQLLVETLNIFLMTLLFTRLPAVPPRAGFRAVQVSTAGVSALLGAFMMFFAWRIAEFPPRRDLGDFFVRTTIEEEHGSNVVNIILSDYRALDTLGEIAVLGSAAIGVLVLLRSAKRKGGHSV